MDYSQGYNLEAVINKLLYQTVDVYCSCTVDIYSTTSLVYGTHPHGHNIYIYTSNNLNWVACREHPFWWSLCLLEGCTCLACMLCIMFSSPSLLHLPCTFTLSVLNHCRS